MKAKRVKTIWGILCAVALTGAGASLVGCADEYAAYPGYGGGYAGYSSYRPYYGGYPYAYAGYPYRPYGPYYGSPYYAPYGGGASVVVSDSRNYRYRPTYRRYYNRDGTVRSRNTRARTTTTNRTSSRTGTTTQQTVRRSRPALNQGDQDDERRYYNPR